MRPSLGVKGTCLHPSRDVCGGLKDEAADDTPLRDSIMAGVM